MNFEFETIDDWKDYSPIQEALKELNATSPPDNRLIDGEWNSLILTREKDKGYPVGFILYNMWEKNDEAVWVATYVFPTYRNKGIARLMKLNLAKELDVNKICGGIYGKNSPSILSVLGFPEVVIRREGDIFTFEITVNKVE